MAESGDRLTRSYRALGREEPPPALDAAILAAARDAVRPRSRNRWAGPVSIAAVLVLGLGISLRMQVEQPGIETSVPTPSASSAEYPTPGANAPPDPAVKEAPPPAPPPQPKLSRQAVEDTAPKPEARARQQEPVAAEALAKKRIDGPPPETIRAEPKPFAESAAPPPAPAAAPMSPAPPPVAQSIAPPAPAASPAPLRAKREAAGAVAIDSAKPDTDERVTELERIARLRRDGRDAEADRALEEFRRKHPDYRIPEAMWERVRPR